MKVGIKWLLFLQLSQLCVSQEIQIKNISTITKLEHLNPSTASSSCFLSTYVDETENNQSYMFISINGVDKSSIIKSNIFNYLDFKQYNNPSNNITYNLPYTITTISGFDRLSQCNNKITNDIGFCYSITTYIYCRIFFNDGSQSNLSDPILISNTLDLGVFLPEILCFDDMFVVLFVLDNLQDQYWVSFDLNGKIIRHQQFFYISIGNSDISTDFITQNVNDYNKFMIIYGLVGINTIVSAFGYYQNDGTVFINESSQIIIHDQTIQTYQQIKIIDSTISINVTQHCCYVAAFLGVYTNNSADVLITVIDNDGNMVFNKDLNSSFYGNVSNDSIYGITALDMLNNGEMDNYFLVYYTGGSSILYGFLWNLYYSDGIYQISGVDSYVLQNDSASSSGSINTCHVINDDGLSIITFSNDSVFGQTYSVQYQSLH